MNPLLFLALSYYVVILAGLLAVTILHSRMGKKMSVLLKKTDESFANLDVSFGRVLASVDHSMADMEARWIVQDRRWRAATGAIGVEWNLALTNDGRIVGGWAY